MVTIVVDDERAQRNGVVVLHGFKSYDISRGFDRLFTRTILDMLDCCLPQQTVAQHCFFASPGATLWGVIGPPIKYLASKQTRLRMVVHGGSNLELIASVQAYNIPKESMPSCLGGNVTDRAFQEWLDNHLKSAGLIE